MSGNKYIFWWGKKKAWQTRWLQTLLAWLKKRTKGILKSATKWASIIVLYVFSQDELYNLEIISDVWILRNSKLCYIIISYRFALYQVVLSGILIKIILLVIQINVFRNDLRKKKSMFCHVLSWPGRSSDCITVEKKPLVYFKSHSLG